MYNFKKFLFFISVILIFPGCATIVSHSTWPFSVDSNPPGAKVSITNKHGKEIFTGKTPTALRLKSGAGFFTKESYVITLALSGYEPRKINVECKINGWYFGNILIGGLIGLLIVDPATGAMYKIDGDGILENLTKSGDTSASLKILEKSQVSKDLESRLVRIN